jgi:hypothetical protein
MPYFDRGNGPLLSVLLPSRSRFDMLCNTIDTFIDKAKDPKNLEVIIKIDNDDFETIRRMPELRQDVLIKTLITPRLNGYASIHEYCNEMVKIATGDWVVLINDDSTMETDLWDTILENITPPIEFKGSQNLACVRMYCIWKRNGQVTSITNNEFPAVRRKACEILGYFALQTHVDSFLHMIYDSLQASIWTELKMNHNKDIDDYVSKGISKTTEDTSLQFGQFMNKNSAALIEQYKSLLL